MRNELSAEEAAGSLNRIETTTDLTRLLKMAVYKREGIPFSTLRKLGLVTPEAAVLELRRRGYELKVDGTGGGKAGNSRQRAKGWESSPQTPADVAPRPTESGVR